MQTNGAIVQRSHLAKLDCCVRQNRVGLASVADVKLAEAKSARPGSISLNPPATVTKTNSSPGRARHKPSNHCAGKVGVPPLNLYARVRFVLPIARETAGTACTRLSLRPSISRDEIAAIARAHHAARTIKCVCFSVIAVRTDAIDLTAQRKNGLRRFARNDGTAV
jgi:hypothetical protein